MEKFERAVYREAGGELLSLSHSHVTLAMNENCPQDLKGEQHRSQRHKQTGQTDQESWLHNRLQGGRFLSCGGEEDYEQTVIHHG
ncbi:Hypothetical protein SMAX5B_010753 [Scophthalmus maximus]|uniref:Uncharacterized protein n=1 Tax=Scophthalmus maximus TaxID=52904 RepID=A0A2U9BXF3_SCOMX|nr:Hypothetical protein SMAX5B_010753 [Scophthalmus maximus]